MQLAPPMEQRFAHGPLSLRLSHLASCSSDGATLCSRSSPYWDSATLQLAPPMEQCFAQGPLPLGLGHLASCSTPPILPTIQLGIPLKKARRPHKCPPRTL
ncbi:hypothetical protein Adt_16031 [Abeliophyllum distichum]|uniref:Uncharacterized protein n=1 Tax=Abeliophyllum distichum TaxID=126358 RepID=A0ABD1TCL7_9LAMI